MISTIAINRFLLANKLRIVTNPCVSPDFCLDWPALKTKLTKNSPDIKTHPQSLFATAAGKWLLLEDTKTGDCAWKLTPAPAPAPAAAAKKTTTTPARQRPIQNPKSKIQNSPAPANAKKLLNDAVALKDNANSLAFPATYANLLLLKNLAQKHNPRCTIFPTATQKLGQSTLGIGARFTTLHWPAVEWAMSALALGVTANQNSIPRELVYDVNAMLEGKLDTVPFPFIGANVPEGHQGQCVEGMSHGSILSKLKTGFHRRGIAWSFNADHQPIGGKFDAREDQLVRGCVLASYITFDLSPELALTKLPDDPQAWCAARIDAKLTGKIKKRTAAAGLKLDDETLAKLLAYVWPAMEKMKVRDEKYRAAREELFETKTGRAYLRELSIDELPGLTTPETTAIMLALCDELGMHINFIAPAFGFQKNMPYPDNAALKQLIAKQWAVCKKFGASIGFHSGSGKSAANYQVMGKVTSGRLEIKTSGRYTYEMGRALHASKNASDQKLWRDWYAFTIGLALKGAFSQDPTEQRMARSFITDALLKNKQSADVFYDETTTRAALEALPPSPEHMFWFEYNFLYVLAAGGKADKKFLGDHAPAGYRQRARFYNLSDEGRLNYWKNVASYIVFLAQNTALAPKPRCSAALKKLAKYETLDAMLADIGK